MKLISILLLILTSLPTIVLATPSKVIVQLKSELPSNIILDKSKITHLVFIDIWRSYNGAGDEAMLDKLPKSFLQTSQKIWLQGEFNVTETQLSQFQQFFPNASPLILDKGSKIMRAFNVWQSPYHVLLKEDDVIFSGDGQSLQKYVGKLYEPETKHNDYKNSDKLLSKKEKMEEYIKSENTSIKLSSKGPIKPLIGDLAPVFSQKTLNGGTVSLMKSLKNNKPISIIFMDSLCPMPHYPLCEEKLAKVNKLVKSDHSRNWIGVISSFYVDQNIAKTFAEKFALNLPLIFDIDNVIFKAYDIYATPYQVNVNTSGLIATRSDIIH